jgi:mxaJ protein
MSSRCRDRRFRALACAALVLVATAACARSLRVCADPDNLPYSDAAERGFENRLARLIANDLDADLSYYWLPQWRGYTRKTLLEGNCDVIPGVPVDAANVRVTAPYYRGSYALVFRADRVPGFHGLDDARLRTLRIGLPLVGIDAVPTPPGRALARRGIYDNVVGFPIVGDKPAAERMLAALARDDIDVAVVWSPQAGYYMARARVPLSMVFLESQESDPRFEFAIAMAVRPDDVALQRALDASLARLQPQIDAVLQEYGVVQHDDDLAPGSQR